MPIILLDCYKCTQSLLELKMKQYPRHYTAKRMPRYRSDIAQGLWAADCIGLAKGYMWWNDAKGCTDYGANGCPDRSADGMLEAAEVKGDISDLPETSGLMLWRKGHVGIYTGDGWAVEARGFNYGIVRTRVSERGWLKWFRLPGCRYLPETAGRSYRVTASSLNLRSGPSVEYDIMDVAHRGDRLYAADCGGWLSVRCGKNVGWVAERYVEETK